MREKTLLRQGFLFQFVNEFRLDYNDCTSLGSSRLLRKAKG